LDNFDRNYWSERWRRNNGKRYDVCSSLKSVKAETDFVWSQIEQWIDGVRSVLDYGCGKGRFVDRFDALGIDYRGVEPCDEARAFCVASFGDRFFERTAQPADLFLAVTVLQYVPVLPIELMRKSKMWIVIDSIGLNTQRKYLHDYSTIDDGKTIRVFNAEAEEKYRVWVAR
jgi:SAM-dependent methyltransferase